MNALKENKQISVATISLNVNTHDLNFGAVLHSYAMQQYLKSLDIVSQTKVINYVPVHLIDYNYKFPFVTSLKKKRIKSTIKKLLGYCLYHGRYNKFDKFIRSNFELTEKYDYNTLKSADLNFDAYICESDVIWTYSFFGGQYDDNYFLKFESATDKIKIAYAPSMANDNLNSIQEIKLKNLISDFDYISCRETYRIEQLSKLYGRPIVHVLDPVFLLEGNEYYKFIKKKPLRDRYLFVYIPVGYNKKLIKEARLFAKKNKLKILEYSAKPPIALKRKIKYNVGIEDFLTAIYYADVIFTNSFHAICFSILFNKEFYAFSRASGGKVEDICKVFGLLDRYFSDDEFVERKKINYDKVDTILTTERNKSKKFLEDALLNKESVK